MEEPKNIKIGKLGEYLASRYLEEKGFNIVGRNYKKPWGEIDIIAEKLPKDKHLTNFSSNLSPSQTIHFVEVKSASVEMREVSHETEKDSDYFYRPEDNLHPRKIKRLQRAIQSYLAIQKNSEKEWQFDVIIVRIDTVLRNAKIKYIENIPV